MYTAVHCRTVFVNSMLYSLTQESILFCLTFHLEYNLTFLWTITPKMLLYMAFLHNTAQVEADFHKESADDHYM